MDTFLRRRSPWLCGWFVTALLWCAAAPAHAGVPPESDRRANAVAVFAEGRSLTSYINHGSARDRVVQISVLCMAAALFILMKKFAPGADGLKNRPGKTPPARCGEGSPGSSRSPAQAPSRKV